MLQLIIAPTARAIEQGKQLIPRIRQELPKVKQQQELLELIETILVYKLPQVSRKEIEAMFSLSDLIITSYLNVKFYYRMQHL
jgi:predicted transposase YdaD